MDNKASAISSFRSASDALYQYISAQPTALFEEGYMGKWSAGQHLDHMIRCIKPLNMAYRLPSFVLRWKFGTPNRPSRSYEALVKRYTDKLANGGAATGAFVPPVIRQDAKEKLLRQFSRQNQQFINVLERYNETKLDQYLLPHPLLGKITLREMVFFTIYHNQHHLNILKERNYDGAE